MLKGILIGLFSSFVFAAFVFALVIYASLPVVEWSHSKDECVKVINFDDNVYSCENLPEKYEMVWVK